jgi:hypothetical protein
MDGSWAYAEVALQVGFGGRSSEHLCVGVDEGKNFMGFVKLAAIAIWLK